MALAAVLPHPGRAQPETRAVVDAAGRHVTVPAPPRRVFPAGPGAAVLVAVLAPDRLAGWTGALPAAAREVLPGSLRDKPVLGRLTATPPTADVARVRDSGADLVVDMGTVNAAYAAIAERIQGGSGVPAILLDGALARTPALLRQAGTLLGTAARGEALAAQAEGLLADTRSRVAGWQPPRLWYGRGERALQAASPASIGTEVPVLLGCTLPTPAAGDPAGASAAPVEVFAPEVVLVERASLAEALRTDPLWAATPAGRAGRILVAPSGPFGWVDGPPSVQRLLGLPWLLSAVRPDLLPPTAMRAEAAGLLGSLFGIAADDGLLDRMLAA
ncbi:TroA family protein [Paracraurococcus lichenis]|uniref:Fe/B12 periplasmic-binding domain-containing protein n=1 Tax=Paracraurococcus lichenis TaxID=3064888 RepID=A0ABT9EA61_9PROT|nr:hypothetical protein [Paracraurococcus sp. LOR1-02]MDO9713058.1 hypothetical protein [Paracraurococcus sp. LOR1-02]